MCAPPPPVLILLLQITFFFLLKTKATPRGLILINDVGLPQNQSPMPPDIFLPSPVCMKGILL